MPITPTTPHKSGSAPLLAASAFTFLALLLADSLFWRTNAARRALTSVGLPTLQGNPVLKSPSADATRYRGCRGSLTATLPRLHPHRSWHSHQRPLSTQSITLMTQLSFDRLDLLEGQCRYWKDRLAAAVYVPFVENYGVASFGLDTLQQLEQHEKQQEKQQEHEESGAEDDEALEDDASGGDEVAAAPVLNTTAAVEAHFAAFHARMEQVALCALDLELVIETFQSHDDPKLGMYPFNAMRNRALRMVSTELVLLLDVDFLPSASLTDLYMYTKSGYEALRKRLFASPTALVLPAFEYVGAGNVPGGKIECRGAAVPSSNTPDDEPGSNKEKDPETIDAPSRSACLESARAAAMPLLDSKRAAVESSQRGELLPFHVKEYAPGHKPTNYTHWMEVLAEELDSLDSTIGGVDGGVIDKALQAERMHRALERYSYAVTWREGYEPFVVMARKYVPWYDERFLGYGHDKVVHVAYMGIQLKVTFLISPTAYVIHLPHPKAPTIAITKDNGQWERLRMLYREAKLQMQKGVFLPVVAFDELCPRTGRGLGGESR